MRKLLVLAVVVAGGVLALPALASAAPIVANGGFETGTASGWTDASSGAGFWSVYSGTTSPLSGFDVPGPPEGSFAFISDQVDPSQAIAYQDLTLPAGGHLTLSFWVYYVNQFAGFVTPPTLDMSVENQQFRVDIVHTSAPLTSVAPGDVLANVFRTSVGDPLTLGPTLITYDLTPWAGQTVRLRLGETDTDFYFQAAVDDVQVTGGSVRLAKSLVCLANPQARPDGTSGSFFDVAAAVFGAGVNDPSSIFYKATPAVFVKGYGTMCRLSDLATYGGDPSTFADAGYKVNESGDPAPPGVDPVGWGAAYEYYVPTG
jgi:hypothetical protein